jgi:hypothetical protein
VAGNDAVYILETNLSSETDEPLIEPPPETSESPEWLRAAAVDLVGVDFEAPLAGINSSDSGEICQLYSVASASCTSDDSPRIRIYKLIGAIAGMHFKPAEGNEPFGPMAVSKEGFRTACPSDFRAHIDLIADMATRAANPVLKARLADLTWLLDRKRGRHALAAIASYVEIARGLTGGKLRRRYVDNDDARYHDAADLLRRALWIGRAAGAWDKPEGVDARTTAAALRERVVDELAAHSVHWLSELDLDQSISEPQKVAGGLETVLSALPTNTDVHFECALWRLAARAHHVAGAPVEKNRCLLAASERLIAHAETMKASAIMEAHFLSAAITQLHGVAGVKERRTALRHRLIDVQAAISDEMPRFSHNMGLGDALERLGDAIARLDLFEQLFIFADIERSPEPETLATEAKSTIEQFPLSSLFAPVTLDRGGKVVHRGHAAGFGDSANAAAIEGRIAESESLRRSVATAKIDTARIEIAAQHFISDDLLIPLLQYSPFVPADLGLTFARGFARFFQGDFVSATYILTPLLEASLRHALKSCGYEASIFDDATETQEDRTISSLFEQMRPELERVFSPAIITDIDHVFLAKGGPHIRHAVAHGLLSDQDPYGSHAVYGCWLLFRLCLMPLFPHAAALRPILGGDGPL